MIRETGWTYEYIEAMPMIRFMGILDEFKILPPLHEVGRAFVVLPGDDGYKPKKKRDSAKVIAAVAKSAGQAPEFIKRGAEKLKLMQQYPRKPRRG